LNNLAESEGFEHPDGFPSTVFKIGEFTTLRMTAVVYMSSCLVYVSIMSATAAKLS